MVANVLVGILLTGALILSLIFSGFILFVVISSQQIRTGNSLLLFQLGSVNGLLAVLFLALSTPSLLQGGWLTSQNHDNFSRKQNSSLQLRPSYDSSANESSMNLTLGESTLLSPLAVRTRNMVSVPLVEILVTKETASNVTWSTIEEDTIVKTNAKRENNVFVALTTVTNSNNNSNQSFDYSGVKNIEKVFIGEGLFCQIYGWILLTLHIAAVWLIVGLQCDKFCAIAAPLRYNTLVTRRRTAIYSLLVWVFAVATASSPLATAQVYIYVGGACLPAWHLHGSLPYTITLAVATLFIPGIVIGGVNSRILVIARYHQHRIFSAIFEVMMSAQATVTHQPNPFSVPKKKTKSTRSVIEQLAAFAMCYCPLFVVALWETCVRRRANPAFETLGVGFFLVSPLINSFIYGIKCKSLRKSFKNYLRKRLYKSEVKSEIEGRVPSAQISRRPSNSSSIGMPFIHRTLKRRMSDYLMKDFAKEDGDEFKMVRRSSDLSWHPLDDRTPSPNRLRKPLDVRIPIDLTVSAHTSVSQYLTVPSFEAAKTYCQLAQTSTNEDRGSICSGDSDAMSEIVPQNNTEEEMLTTPDDSPMISKSRGRNEDIPRGDKLLFLPPSSPTDSFPFDSFRKFSINSSVSKDGGRSCTPLLISAFEKPANEKPVNTSSPYVVRTIEALMSIGLSQSLLRTSYFWKAKSSESLNKNPIKCHNPDASIQIEPLEDVPGNYCLELVTINRHVKTERGNSVTNNGNLNNNLGNDKPNLCILKGVPSILNPQQ